MDNFEGVADHVVGLVEGSETRQNLVINTLSEQDSIEWIKLFDLTLRDRLSLESLIHRELSSK